MLDIFDILGPVMVGPSSSHTAGAVRIGRMARTLLDAKPVRAEIGLYGSFAETGRGHGTDRALVAGLLGMAPDNLDVPGSFRLAAEQGLAFSFRTVQGRPPQYGSAGCDGGGRPPSGAAGGLHRRRTHPGGTGQRRRRELYGGL
jgi:L-serine dehydratase